MRNCRHHIDRLCAGAFAAALFLVTAAATPVAAQEIVKIGEIEAQTGALNTYGWMSSQGMRMAVDEINKAGGFEVAGKTYKLALLNPDTQGNPQQALIELKKMLEQEHVRFVFGPFLTNVYKGIEPYATGFDGKFLLMGGATAIHFDLGKPKHDFAIRTWNWDAGASGFGSLMVANLKQRGAKKVAMLMQNDAFGHVARDIYAPLFKDAGIVFEEEWFEPGTTDFSSVLAKIAANKPDYVFPGYSDAVLYDIVHQATELGLTRFWLVRGSLGPGLKNKDYLDDYIIYIPKYFEEAQNTEPKVKKFVADYKAFYKTDFPYDQAPLCSSSCYDHVFMLVEAMKRAGTVDDVAKVKEALLSFTYNGLWNIRYDATGEEVFNFDVVDIKKGGKIEVTHIAPK
ncbi:MAG TPA: ABC transporter substrate-binding protein [Alphaproteobacteria bacterium]|nr:ABC transporter substrate-binding protein [Alphaproteobacteria bacterium]